MMALKDEIYHPKFEVNELRKATERDHRSFDAVLQSKKALYTQKKYAENFKSYSKFHVYIIVCSKYKR